MTWLAPRLLVGDRFNVLERGSVVVTSQQALYPPSRLYDGRVALPFRFAAPAGTDENITVDGDLLGGIGSMETWPTPWTVVTTGAGAVAQDTVTKNSGTSSAKLTNAVGGTAAIQRDYQARCGEFAKIEWAIRGDATATARLRVQNLLTGRYLTAGGAWTSVVTDLATQQAAAFATGNLTFQVEAFTVCLPTDGTDLATIRVSVVNTTNSANSVWADDIYLYPGVDVLSVHGHTITPAVTVELRSSTDNFAANDVLQGTAVLVRRTFYVLLGARVYMRWWRVKCVGANLLAPIELGEVVIGQTFTPARRPQLSVELGELEADLASETDGGEQYVYLRQKHARRTVGLRFVFVNDAQVIEAREEIFARTRGRGKPLVVIPDAAKPDVIHGRVDRRWRVVRTLDSWYTDNDLPVSESPFPATGA